MYAHIALASELTLSSSLLFCSQEIEKDPAKFQTTWDDDKKTFALQLFFKL